MNPYCVDIQLDIFPLNSSINIESYDSEYRTFLPRYHLNMEFLRFLKSVRLKADKAEIFYSLPDAFTPIHIDADHTNMGKLNWSFCDGDHTMNWYRTDVIKPMKTSDKNTSYRGYTLNEVSLVHSQAVGFPSIIQAGVPHNVTNGKSTRRCLSVILIDTETDKCPTMEVVIERLSGYIK